MTGYRKYFISAIRHYYPLNAALLITTTDNHFAVISADTAFARHSANSVDRRLDFSAYFLAFIKSLDNQGESFGTIRKICLEIVTNYVMPKNKLQQFLKRLLPKLINTWIASIFLEKFSRSVRRKAHPDGFVANIITEKAATYGLG